MNRNQVNINEKFPRKKHDGSSATKRTTSCGQRPRFDQCCRSVQAVACCGSMTALAGTAGTWCGNATPGSAGPQGTRRGRHDGL